MISAQHGPIFTKSEYGKIRKVYSIWICTQPSDGFENTYFDNRSQNFLFSPLAEMASEAKMWPSRSHFKEQVTCWVTEKLSDIHEYVGGVTPDFLDVLEEGFKEFFEKEVSNNPLKAEYFQEV